MGEKLAQHELEEGEKITILGSKIPFGQTAEREGNPERSQERCKLVVFLDCIRITCGSFVSFNFYLLILERERETLICCSSY